MATRVITTSDGSKSVYIEEIDEAYHSFHGAIQESMHVFINSGLKFVEKSKNSINILEVGMGTGLNVLLTCLHTESNIKYTAIEKYPLPFDIIKELNFSNFFNNTNSQDIFSEIHNNNWGKEFNINKKFTLEKINLDIKSYENKSIYDLIYYDAFAPSAQSEMWEEAILNKMYKMLNNNGILVTYCAKGVVKRTLKKIGFHVEALPGPIGKREITRAIKT